MIGHNFTPEEIIERVKKFWDLSEVFPLPLKPVPCPECKSEETIIKQCRFFERLPKNKNNYRCDILFKCTVCSCVWQHGVKVPSEMAKPKMKDATRTIQFKSTPEYSWRDMLKMMEEA